LKDFRREAMDSRRILSRRKAKERIRAKARRATMRNVMKAKVMKIY